MEGGGWRVCVRVCNVEYNIGRPGKKAFLLVNVLASGHNLLVDRK